MMLEEILSWVALLNVKKALTAQSVSNLILLMYCAQYLLCKEARFLWAFLFCEVFGLSVLSRGLSASEFYSVYAFAYVLMYFYCSYVVKSNIKILSCCAIMVAFELTMVTDAILFPDIPTAIWHSYAIIVLLIHCLLFLSGTDFRKATNTIRDFMLFMRNTYNNAFI